LLGCNWNGPFNTLSSHLIICEYPDKNGFDLIDTIRAQKRAYDEEKKCLETVVDLLSLNQIGVSGKLLSSRNLFKKDFMITEKMLEG
jgi:hypothetical protein